MTTSDVLRVYSGRANTCMCGCAGRYYCAPARREAVGASRGYPVTDDEVSERMVKRVLNVLADNKVGRAGDEPWTEVVVGAQSYVVYWA